VTTSYKQDIKISVDVPQKDGTVRKLSLTELDDIQDVYKLAEVSKRVAITDTADLIFRLFAKSQQGDADLRKISSRIPCMNGKYLPDLQRFFKQPENAEIIQEYNSSNDKAHKRELRKQMIDKLEDFVVKNISTRDLQFNFSKFKYKYDKESLSLKEKMLNVASKLSAKIHGLNDEDPFTMAAFDIWKDNIEKRTEQNRQAHWLLVRDEHNTIIGITCVSSKQLKDKRVDKNIIGHAGCILDPSAQGCGFATALLAVMADFMYDNTDKQVAENSLFATTCDEFNENSQGLNKKLGSQLLKDENGNAVIDKGKMHWYATKDQIMNSELMKQAAERGVKYTVTYVDGRPGYSKGVGNNQQIVTLNTNLKGFDNDRQ
jgi:RimJ/RimL family protein N-acetyltransferase